MSARGSLVEISARKLDSELEIDIADRGIGIPASDLERVSDKFYRVQRPSLVYRKRLYSGCQLVEIA